MKTRWPEMLENGTHSCVQFCVDNVVWTNIFGRSKESIQAVVSANISYIHGNIVAVFKCCSDTEK